MSSRTHGWPLTRGGLAAVSLLSLTAVCPAYAQALATTKPTLSVTIPSGTRLGVVLGQQLSTRTDRVGDTFQLSLAKSVVIDGETVLAEGTPLLGQIVDLTPGWQKAGRLTLVLYRLLLEEAGVAIPIQSKPLTLKRKVSAKEVAILGSVVVAAAAVLNTKGDLWGTEHAGSTFVFVGVPVLAAYGQGRSTDLVLAPKKKLLFRLITDVTIEKP